MPGSDVVLPGPRRDLLARVHVRYDEAGRPPTRLISKRIDAVRRQRLHDLDPVSHETVSALLRGAAVPGWSKIRSIVVVLCAMSVRVVDMERELAAVNALWVRV